MRTLIIWNNDAFASTLTQALGNPHLISNAKDLESSEIDLHTYDAIIVLCELRWTIKGNGAQLQEFAGIDLVKRLRRSYEVSCLVLFMSFQPLSLLFSADREILTAIGHRFIQLPIIPQELTTYIQSNSDDGNGIPKRLSAMELSDIKSFYCDKEGILSHELHALSHFLNLRITDANHSEIYDDLLQVINRVHSLFLLDASSAELAFRVAFPKMSRDNIGHAVSQIVRIGNDLLETYGNADSNAPATKGIAEEFRWRVLLLDDQIDREHELVKQMEASGIHVICVDNADDATDQLLSDWKKDNTIMVVIADYRLFENINGVKHHQKIQGYQFLKDIATSDHLIRLVAFSGLQRKFLLNSFKYYNIRTEVKSKNDYLPSKETRQLFCKEIIELAEENWDAIEALPHPPGGFKSLIEGYMDFRRHPNYLKMENNISSTAEVLIQQIEQQMQVGDEIRINRIEFITSPMTKSKKNSEAYFNRFQNYLVARRIALWLYVAKRKNSVANLDSRRIAEILTNQKYPTNAYRQILSTNLGLSLDDFPMNITIEERRWLHYDMQLGIMRDIEQMNPVFSKLGRIFGEFILGDDSLKQFLRLSNHKLLHQYKKTEYVVNFDSEFSPRIMTSTDVRVVFLWLAEKLHNDKTQLSSFKPLVSKIRFALFESRERVVYLRNLFHYFNNFYSKLNTEQTVLVNASTKVIDKAFFQSHSAVERNKAFERAFQMLVDEDFPISEDSADVFTLFVIGEEVIHNNGRTILQNKAKFFSELTKAINRDNSLIKDLIS